MAERTFEATFWDDPDHLTRVFEAERFGTEAYYDGRSTDPLLRVRTGDRATEIDRWVIDGYKRGWHRARLYEWVRLRGGYQDI